MKSKNIILLIFIVLISTILLVIHILKPNKSNKDNLIEANNIENKIEYNNIIVSKTPFEEHGKLKVVGTNIVDENNNTIQLKGISTHGIADYPQYVNKDTFKYLRDTYGVNLIRLAVYSEDYTKSQMKTIKDGINFATELGMYVIVDWHTLKDNNPNKYKEIAKQFFIEIATEYKNNNNIIYEICNEPNGNVTWENDIKPYAKEIIQSIRNITKDSIILCGTPDFCKQLKPILKSPIENEQNIMYTLHFYSATHKEGLRKELSNALDKGLPVFISEFGISEANGDGNINIQEANKWIELLNSKNISFVYWNLSNKDEKTAFLKSSTIKLRQWNYEELSEAGKWFVSIIENKKI